jgi:hypothetical protein
VSDYVAKYRKTIRENHKLYPENPWLAAEKIQKTLQSMTPLIEEHDNLADILDEHAPILRPNTDAQLRAHLAKLPAANREFIEATQAAIIPDLNVGPNNVMGTNSGAIGAQNSVIMPRSLAVGFANTVNDDDNQNSSLAVGIFNYVEAFSAIVCGNYNQTFAGYSLTAGSYNINTEYNSLVLGEYNITSNNRHRNGILLGAYNAPITKASHLVIGNGTSTSNRKNSFIIYADGDIVITKPQGDISMGIYE